MPLLMLPFPPPPYHPTSNVLLSFSWSYSNSLSPIVDHLFYSFPPILSQFSVLLLTRRAPPLRATSTATPVLTLTLPYTYLIYSLFPSSRHYIYCLTLIPALLCLLLDYLSYSFTSTLSEFVSHPPSTTPPLSATSKVLPLLVLLCCPYTYGIPSLVPISTTVVIFPTALPRCLLLQGNEKKSRRKRVG